MSSQQKNDCKTPNILFIMTDQQRFDMLSINGGQSKSPALERLVDGGINFTNAYTTCSVCSPARASVFTGRYPHRHTMINNCDMAYELTQELPESEILMIDYLKEQGYNCGYAGKWHVGKYSSPIEQGFDGVSGPGYGGGEAFGVEYDKYLEENGLKRPEFIPLIGTGHPTVMAGYIDGELEATVEYFLVEKSIELLKSYKSEEKPFFMTLQFWGPHEQARPTIDYLEMYPPEDVELWGSFHDTLEGKPRQYERFLKDFNSHYFDAHKFSEDEWKKINASYLAYNTLIEDQVCRLLDEIEKLELSDDLVTIYSTDHGNSSGMRGGFCQKAMTMFEDLYHIPLVVKWPGVTSTCECDKLVSNMDIFSTVLDLIGAESRNEVDSESLVPLLKSSDAPWRDALITQRNGAYNLHSQRMIRWKNYKYIFTPYDIDELYDLEADPYELTNQINSPDLEEIKNELQKKLIEEAEKSKDPILTALKGFLHHVANA